MSGRNVAPILPDTLRRDQGGRGDDGSPPLPFGRLAVLCEPRESLPVQSEQDSLNDPLCRGWVTPDLRRAE